MRDVAFKVDAVGIESVSITFNRFYTPEVSAIEGKKARIVIDIADASSFRKEWRLINVRGRIVKRIRGSDNPRTRSVRLVLDLEPSKDYNVQPVIRQGVNVYTLEISVDDAKKRLPLNSPGGRSSPSVPEAPPP
jgi:hypothetical protein